VSARFDLTGKVALVTGAIQAIERGVSELIAVSAGGRMILYTQQGEAGSELMLMENFR
jgi:NAD(P)-dependent dehydrogenase (short-subunit alcohol dehydrogenase family)